VNYAQIAAWILLGVMLGFAGCQALYSKMLRDLIAICGDYNKMLGELLDERRAA
jgi:hypothetical protein